MEEENNLIKNAKNILKKHFEAQLKLSSSEIEIHWYNLKYEHSLLVYEITTNIIKNEINLSKIKENDKAQIGAGALLHDIGRFYQIKNGTIIKAWHGDLGKKILEKTKEIQDPAILFLIQYHDDTTNIKEDNFYKTCTQDEKDLLIKKLSVVRDADMLAIIERAKSDDKFFSFFNGKDRLNPVINPEMLNAFKEKRPFRGSHQIITVYDALLAKLLFFNLLSYEYSKKIYNESKNAEYIFMLLEKFKKDSFNLGFTDQEKLDIDFDFVKNFLK